jgi:hypothetical protein
MFNPAEFFPALAAHGLLKCAQYVPPSGPTWRFDVGFSRPDELLFGDQAQSTEYAIEYEAARAPQLDVDMVLTIDGVQFRVRSKPRAKGDGSFLMVELERVRR